MKNENIISASGYFDGQKSKGNFDVELKASFTQDSLPDALQFVAGIGRRLNLIAIIENEKVKLGQFTVYSIRVDKNQNCVVTFKSNKDSCFIEDFSKIMIEEALITFKAKIIEE